MYLQSFSVMDGWCIIKKEKCVCMNVSSHDFGLRITSDLNVSMFMQVCKSHDNKLQINSNYYWTWKLKLWKIETNQTNHTQDLFFIKVIKSSSCTMFHKIDFTNQSVYTI